MTHPTDEERRAYREGRIDAKLEEHSSHLAAINGSQERTSVTLERISQVVDKIGIKVDGLLAELPKLRTIAEQVKDAELVAEALKKKKLESSSFWDRNRAIVAWTLGTIAVVVSTSSTLLRLFQ